MTWTHFHDMHSGGGSKEPFGHIFIEAPEAEAEIIFYNRFGHNPHRVSCTCCGADYSLSEYETLEAATAYQRNLRYAEDARGWLYGNERPTDYREGRYLEPGEAVPEGMRVKETYRKGDGETLDTYLSCDHSGLFDGAPLVIRADEIKPEWRVGELPSQGYVWVD